MPNATPELIVEGAIATITLRRPEMANRLDLDDLLALQGFIQAVNADEAVRVLRLRGEGRHFCSGFNVERVGADGADASARFEALADALEQARPVTVVQLQGGAYGGAVDLCLACDFRVGGPATELRVPAVALGLHFYRGGLERAVARIGLPWARRLYLLADSLDATTLQGAGLIDRLAPRREDVAEETLRLCHHLAGLAPLALLGMKRHMNRMARGALDADALARDIAQATASADLQEGALAWREKRPPRFVGR